MHPLSTRPGRNRPLTFTQYLDQKLDQATWRNEALDKLDRLYGLNHRAGVVEARLRSKPNFAELTFYSPAVDRDDPLGVFAAPAAAPAVEP
ncbi:MAG TPA: hypothetical protein PLE81_11200 [Brevundimonas sp.]|jgi:hypothetical protein|uniref:hypothetical protein n=1 Tax=Brevundimonas sp. TaxID=1871086 RepID=UPI002C88CFE2|nr:hypothetical protein [Brevundimonas sp.]HRH21187.1 hypothetical protein [Brevundimonas sp.]